MDYFEQAIEQQQAATRKRARLARVKPYQPRAVTALTLVIAAAILWQLT
jgi:hypothetical protein